MGIPFTQLRYQIHGLAGVSVAIILGVAFVTAALLFGAVTERATWNAVAAQYDGADIVVTSEETSLGSDQLATVQGLPGVATAEGRPLTFTEAEAGSRTAILAVTSLPEAESIRAALSLEAGSLPAGPGEVALLANLAGSLAVDVGDLVQLSAGDGTVDVTVSGLLDVPPSLGGTAAPDAYLWPSDQADWYGTGAFRSILVTIAGGTSADELTGTITGALDGTATARTQDDQARSEVASYSGGTDLLTYGLVAFAVVALFVAGLVIANTFAILVAQRTRTLALFRCVGATRRQIRSMVLVEAAITGLVASALGVLTGIAILTVGLRVVVATGSSAIVGTSIPFSPVNLSVPIVLGVIVTLVAAFGPARAATRVPPLSALRPVAVERRNSRPSLLRLGLAASLVVGGAVLLGGGVLLSKGSSAQVAILVGMAGGLLSFLGVVLGGILFIPPMIRTLGQIVAPLAGPPARLASANSDRNPSRTTATATALLVAVTLVTMMLVGAETTRSTLSREIDERSPVDIIVQTQEDYSGTTTAYPAIPGTVTDTLSADPDIAVTMPVRQAELPDPEQGSMTVLAFDPAIAREVFRDPRQVEPLAPGVAVASEDWALNRGVVDGETIALGDGDRQLNLTVMVTDWGDWRLLIDPADLDRLVPGTVPSQTWARLTDAADPGSAIGNLQDRLAGTSNVWVTGGAQEKADNDQILDTILLVVTALLGVAVAIALIGVGNTLSLSVAERTRESAVLRALGLTRRQLRGMLAIEGILLAVAGAALGVVLGTAYGLLGALTLLGGSWGVVVSVPAIQLVAVVVVAIVAGLLASVLPAGTAARTPPVAALAE
ncbi:MAG TPA: FtsX-like permease family protein [Thermomicrobiales bacterium]|jgi:putative ABC transport system permease protein|nr:FtsX-like permease family protein [Thermomicrobiales bacterium]